MSTPNSLNTKNRQATSRNLRKHAFKIPFYKNQKGDELPSWRHVDDFGNHHELWACLRSATYQWCIRCSGQEGANRSIDSELCFRKTTCVTELKKFKNRQDESENSQECLELFFILLASALSCYTGDFWCFEVIIVGLTK
jgi:hypothetical protein